MEITTLITLIIFLVGVVLGAYGMTQTENHIEENIKEWDEKEKTRKKKTSKKTR